MNELEASFHCRLEVPSDRQEVMTFIDQYKFCTLEGLSLRDTPALMEDSDHEARHNSVICPNCVRLCLFRRTRHRCTSHNNQHHHGTNRHCSGNDDFNTHDHGTNRHCSGNDDFNNHYDGGSDHDFNNHYDCGPNDDFNNHHCSSNDDFNNHYDCGSDHDSGAMSLMAGLLDRRGHRDLGPFW